MIEAKMSDLIDRKKALDEISKIDTSIIPSGWVKGYVDETIKETQRIIRTIPFAEPEAKWIPFTMRELTTEEKEEHPEWDGIMDCKLPDDGEEILVSNGKFVWSDTFINDGDGCYLDGDTELDGCAWMPLPEAWRGE